MAQSDLTRVIEPACQKLAEQQGFELVDVELVREGASRYLRIYIDKPVSPRCGPAGRARGL